MTIGNYVSYLVVDCSQAQRGFKRHRVFVFSLIEKPEFFGQAVALEVLASIPFLLARESWVSTPTDHLIRNVTKTHVGRIHLL